MGYCVRDETGWEYIFTPEDMSKVGLSPNVIKALGGTMSSDIKDARWALATNYADGLGLEFEDFTYSGWQKLLDEAQRKLDKTPEDIPFWKERFEGMP